MYSGQPPPHPHQLQNAQQPFHASGTLPVDPGPQGIMDAPDFNAFQYGFSTLHDPNTIIALPNQPDAGPPGPFGDGGEHSAHGQHVAVSQLPQDAMGGLAESHASLDAASSAGVATPAEGASRDRKSSITADPLDDSVNDDFESGHNRADGTDLGGKAKDANATDTTPAWSELKTKAGKDRKRLPLACIACRRKKIRCSGEKPACKHCLRSRIPCVYKVTTRKAAPRTDYMAMLDKRLKRMEERIIKVIPKSDQESTPNVTRAVVKPAIPGTLPGSKISSKKRGAEEAFGPGLEAWANTSTKNNSVLGGGLSPGAEDSDEGQLLQEGSESLPSKDIQEHLSEVYFENVYGQAYPLLHKPSYMRKLHNNTLPPVLILSVCAVAARFSTNPKLNSSTRQNQQFLRGEEWAGPARDICTQKYESPNITILTCLLILGLHEFGTCQGGRSWALGGQAIRMAFALQLHKDLDRDPMSRNGDAKLSFVDREIRRRIMWSCYIMDRFISSGTERPMFIKDDDVNIPLPVRERHFQLDMPAVTETLSGIVPPNAVSDLDSGGNPRDNIGVAALLVRAIALWGRITAYVNHGGKEADSEPIWSPSSGFAKLLNEAQRFPSSLPEPLLYSADNLALHCNHQTTNQFVLLHIIAQHCILFLSRASLSPASGRPEDFTQASRSKAFAAAGKISELVKASEDNRVPLTAPFAAYCAFASTMMHIRAIVSGDPTTKATAEANATINIKFLRKMMKYWGMFHWMEEEIRSHYRNTLDRSRSGASADDNEIMSPIIQYGDWFNHYPHGVSDNDFMDPATQKKKDKGADGVLEQKAEFQSVEEFFTTLTSPQAPERQGTATQPPKAKRKATKKNDGPQPKAAPKSQPGPSLELSAANERRSSVAQEQQMTPTGRQPSAQVASQTNGTQGFHALTSSHPQSNAYHAISPISPVNVEQFQPPQHGQAAFYQPNMMHMGMPQPGNAIMQPIDHQLSFGTYTMDSPGMSASPHVMNGGPGWHNVPDGQQVQTQGGGHNMAMGQPNPGHGQGQPGPNGMNNEGWFMPFDMQQANGGNNMGVPPNNPNTYNDMFSGSGMSAQNPLGGLRHAQ